MQLRYRLYPYPVIVDGFDYYKDSFFVSYVQQEMDGYNVKLTLKVELNNTKLLEMVEQGDVIYAHHIECSHTCYRKLIKTKDKQFQCLLKDTDVNGIVQICSFLIANKDIKQYTNNSFSDDYKGINFDIDKGCILAVGNQFDLRIEKHKDDLKNTSSIFSIVNGKDSSEGFISYDIDNQKIIITLPDATYKQYCCVQTNPELIPIMHSILIIPALSYAFSELVKSGDNIYEYEDYRWFRSLKKACASIGVELSEKNLNTIDTIKLPQQLMDSPITKAIAFCAEGSDED